MWIEVIADLQAKGYSQAEIAKACGCSQPTVSELATGKLKDPRHAVGEALLALRAKTKKRQQKERVNG
jgi:transcriptional regulator with XRE-family HTH domain